ncbi:hypothetical protein [Streptomyces incanus]|uniref:Orn/Lys/Arg decarboxylase C-terminal domain-containing protein n=1 Tax=Streptomyces incanus TaxID=887453 RepID=A0ABW0XSE7_9ACTN
MREAAVSGQIHCTQGHRLLRATIADGRHIRAVGEDFAHGLEQAVLPREVFLAEVEQVSVERAAGRTAAEMTSPYPPGVPVMAPGEVITNEVLDHLRTGVNHGVLIQDAADPSVGTLRGAARH